MSHIAPMRSAGLLLLHATACGALSGFFFQNTLVYQKTLNFPKTPIALGIAHIHSPHRFLPRQAVFDMPRFQLRDVESPRCIGNYSTVAIHYTNSVGQHEFCRLFASDPRCCHLFLFKGDTPYLSTCLRVSSLGAYGHSIAVDIQMFREPTIWEKIVLPIVMKESIWDAAMRESHVIDPENPCLTMYRRLVTGV